MAVSLVAGSAVSGTGSSTSIAKPTTSGYTETAQDLILISCESASTTTAPTPPTGFTTLTTLHTGSGAHQQDTTIAWKLDSGSESWPKGFTDNGGNFDVWQCLVLRGVDQTTPIDANSNIGITSGSSLSIPSVTATVAGDLLVIFVIDENDVNVSSWPSGVAAYANATNSGNGVMCGTESGLASGATGTLSVTVGASPGVVQGFAILVKAAAGSSLNTLGTPTRDVFDIRTNLSGLPQATFQTRLSGLLVPAHDGFSIAAQLDTPAHDTFVTRLQLDAPARDQFVTRAGLTAPGRASFATRLAGLSQGARATFATAAGLVTAARDTFKIGVSGLRTLATWAHAQFEERAGQTTNGRARFATRLTGLGQPARAGFATRVSLGAAGRARFLGSLALAARARAQFVGRAWLIQNAQARFASRYVSGLKLPARFSVRTSLGGHAHATFKTVIGLRAWLRDTFKVNGQVVVLPFRAAYVGLKQRLSGTFTDQPRLAGTFTTKPRLSAAVTRSLTVAKPNSTIQVTMQATDISGAHPANLSAISVQVTFPDGTTSTYTMAASQVTNNLDGTYTLIYQTKGVGENVEIWSFTAANGTDTDSERNITPVSY